MPLSATLIFLITLFDACFLGVALLLMEPEWGLLGCLAASAMVLVVHLPIYLMIDALRYRFHWPPWTILLSAAVMALSFPLLIWLTDGNGTSGFTSMQDVVYYGMAILFLPSLPMGFPLTVNYYWERGRRPIRRRRATVDLL